MAIIGIFLLGSGKELLTQVNGKALINRLRFSSCHTLNNPNLYWYAEVKQLNKAMFVVRKLFTFSLKVIVLMLKKKAYRLF